MKKVLYIALVKMYGKKSEMDGVSNKIYGQCKALMDNGWDTWLIAYNDNGVLLSHLNSNKMEELKGSKKKIRRYRIFDEVKNIVYQKGINAVYIRYPYADLQFLSMLSKIKKSGASIYIEISTFPIERWGIKYGIKNLVMSRLDYIFGQFLKKYVTQFRIMGSNSDQVYGVPAVNISNCIDCTNIPKKALEGSETEFTIITVSRMNDYHGYDRLIRGLENYYSNCWEKPVRLIMAGGGMMRDIWENLAIECNVADHVDFIGAKSKEELTPYYDNAHIAIGSLGLHRAGFSKISTLKCKEYCARGIPFACANIEIGFDPDFPFILQLEPDELPIDIYCLIKEYEAIKKRYPKYIEDMRKYAEINLDWHNQMKLDEDNQNDNFIF